MKQDRQGLPDFCHVAASDEQSRSCSVEIMSEGYIGVWVKWVYDKAITIIFKDIWYK